MIYLTIYDDAGHYDSNPSDLEIRHDQSVDCPFRPGPDSIH